MADATGHAPSRRRAATVLALAGALTLGAALLIHDFAVFGAGGHDLIAAGDAPCTDPPCLTTDMVIAGHVAKSIGAALVFAVIGAVWVAGRTRLLLASAFWVAQYAWSLLGIASGHRAQFGTTWAWWEPFAELMWHPPLTLGAMATGVAAFVLLARWGIGPARG